VAGVWEVLWPLPAAPEEGAVDAGVFGEIAQLAGTLRGRHDGHSRYGFKTS
jgi:hypothetical protein